METTQKAIEDESDQGKNLSQKEKQSIHKSIDEVEEKILQLKVIVDKNLKDIQPDIVICSSFTSASIDSIALGFPTITILD